LARDKRFDDGGVDLGTATTASTPRRGSTIPRSTPPRAPTAHPARRHGGGIAREWWHFILIGEPYREMFDFPVSAHPRSKQSH
jgi:hypothetical protein